MVLNGNRWELYETPLQAVLGFQRRAEHWRDHALSAAAWAERDLAFVEHRSMESILRYAKEQ